MKTGGHEQSESGGKGLVLPHCIEIWGGGTCPPRPHSSFHPWHKLAVSCRVIGKMFHRCIQSRHVACCDLLRYKLRHACQSENSVVFPSPVFLRSILRRRYKFLQGFAASYFTRADHVFNMSGTWIGGSLTPGCPERRWLFDVLTPLRSRVCSVHATSSVRRCASNNTSASSTLPNLSGSDSLASSRHS